MKRDELIKLAKENKEVRDALLTITKTAANENTQFDESVPAVGAGNPNQGPTPQGPQPGTGAAPVQAPAGAVDANAQAMAMAGQEQGVDPGAEGAKAAQAFMAPVFEAASQGDPNAQKTIAIAAGEIARGVSQAAHEATSGEAAPMQDAAAGSAQPMQGAPVAAPGPEEQVANQIVTEPQAAPTGAVANATPEGEEAPAEGEQGKEVKKDGKKPFPPKKDDKKDEKKKETEKTSELMFSADTLKGIVQLVRNGII